MEKDWIKMSDRKPTKEDSNSIGNVEVMFMGRVTTWYYKHTAITEEITHWRPLSDKHENA